MNEAMNRDIRPPTGMLTMPDELRCLADTPQIAAEFDRFEQAAKAWKRRYTIAGVAGLVISFCGMGLLGIQVTMPAVLAGSTAAARGGLALAAAGVCIATFFLVGKPRKRWLLARFAAEWMRCLKFRMFLMLEEVGDPAALTAAVAARTETSLQRFRYHLLGGQGAMHFSPCEVVRDARAAAPAVMPLPQLAAAKSLYADMRVGVQLQHFAARQNDKENEMRPARSAGDLFFLAGFLLTLTQIGIEGVNLILGQERIVLPAGSAAFMALGSWIFYAASATLLIWERGRGTALDRERYSRYHDKIEQSAQTLHDTDLAGFMAIVAEVEELCLWELQDFCHDNERSSYLV